MRMEYLKYKIESYKGGLYYCVVSDDNSEKLVMHVRLNLDNVSSRIKSEYDLIMANRNTLLDMKIRGIPGIEMAQIDNNKVTMIDYDRKTGIKSEIKEWVVYTSGTNLKEILSLDGVDSTRTISNDIYEVYNVLGIEAARKLLFIELSRIYGEVSKINYHPICLLADFMTHYGYLMPISRHGINRTDTSPLAKASFEETLEQLTEASIYGSVDNMKGMTANIIQGQMIPAGTGANMDILYKVNHKELPTSEDQTT